MNNSSDIFHIFRKRQRSFYERIAQANRPEVLLVISFAAVILIGSVLLTMPFSNILKPVGYLDNLFVSVSAVCVTGLTTVNVSAQYNLFGKIIVMILMQMGGLGPMTIIAVILQRNSQRMGMTEKKVFAAGAGKSDLYNVPQYIRRIFRYTLLFEGIGFILLSLRMIPVFGTGDGLFNALFLSVSAFTNAGFDSIGSDSLVRFVGDPVINLTVMSLIITGGLGFVVWFELKSIFENRLHRQPINRQNHQYLSEHATIVLKATAILLISGMALFAFIEYTNPGTLAGMTGSEKLFASMFQSVTLRTAGFSTVVIGRCTRGTLLIMCVYMLIGGSPGGTAGGMKTTTAAVLIKTALNVMDEKHEDAIIRHRRIPSSILKHVLTLFSLYISIILIAVVILTFSEPELGFLELMFEVFSAIATVGLSAGITSSLSALGKVVIMILMFVGRVGPLSIFAAFHKELRQTEHVRYLNANIMIG